MSRSPSRAATRAISCGGAVKNELKCLRAGKLLGQSFRVVGECLLISGQRAKRLQLRAGQLALCRAKLVEPHRFVARMLLSIDQSFETVVQPGKLLGRQVDLRLSTRLGQLLLGVVEVAGGRCRVIIGLVSIASRGGFAGLAHLISRPRQAAGRLVGLQSLKLTSQSVCFVLQRPLFAAESLQLFAALGFVLLLSGLLHALSQAIVLLAQVRELSLGFAQLLDQAGQFLLAAIRQDVEHLIEPATRGRLLRQSFADLVAFDVVAGIAHQAAQSQLLAQPGRHRQSKRPKRDRSA